MRLLNLGEVAIIVVAVGLVFLVGSAIQATTYDPDAPMAWTRACTIGNEDGAALLRCGRYSARLEAAPELKDALKQAPMMVRCTARRTTGLFAGLALDCGGA